MSKRRAVRRTVERVGDYFIFAPAARALAVSVALTLLALFVFGYVKGHFAGARPIRITLQTALVAASQR